ncbi:conserved hypothetical protein [Culex quinquefasciatus]|uniref:Ig-like domain-containing protein n=1 Tax=Culex quinquefasciatus TaxID=7176 RepID=B0WYK2_CULQU|nr:conserved hypothetical protein [Culex quinquefasciatus]|eukprot:XP_001862474.1 conserved hypothetical protein [Culex quinquefasciatus]
MEYALRLSLQLALFGNGWSVSETFRCDSFRHCLDGSDEQGCQEAQFVQLPPENVTLTVGDLLNLTCVASGVPAPSIDWKMNGKLPGGDCDWSTEGGVGQLSCRLRLIDAGNYSCTARQPSRREIESRGTMVNVTGNACREGFFSESGKRKLCLKCFCSGVSTLCQAANLYRWNYTMAMNDWKMKYAAVMFSNDTQHLDIKSYDKFETNFTPYYKLPYRFKEYQVGSYDGNLQYEIQVDNTSYSKDQPDIILQGYNATLFYKYKTPLIPGRSNKVVLRIHESNFRHQDGKKASRDDLMIVLAYINLFLIRMYPTNGTYAPSSTDIVMDSSTDLGYHGLGKMDRIEECRCPHGYRGRSCERCDFGYNRANRYLATGICMPWEWHREEYYKVSTSTTMRNYHYV